MGERMRPSIIPKTRPGEIMPEVSVGKQLVRFYGELVLVSEKANEDYYQGSGYTERQIGELEQIRQKRIMQARGMYRG